VRVSVTFQATPAEAKLFLDGEALTSNPATKLVLANGAAHVLRAKAPGFAESTREFSPTKDMLLELALVPLEREGKAAAPAASDTPSGSRRAPQSFRAPVAPIRPPVASGPSPGAPTAAPAAPKPNCDSPFFLDKDGIRRVRPECR
jgi:serine/threonine-protein kinase